MNASFLEEVARNGTEEILAQLFGVFAEVLFDSPFLSGATWTLAAELLSASVAVDAKCPAEGFARIVSEYPSLNLTGISYGALEAFLTLRAKYVLVLFEECASGLQDLKADMPGAPFAALVQGSQLLVSSSLEHIAARDIRCEVKHEWIDFWVTLLSKVTLLNSKRFVAKSEVEWKKIRNTLHMTLSRAPANDLKKRREAAKLGAGNSDLLDSKGQMVEQLVEHGMKEKRAAEATLESAWEDELSKALKSDGGQLDSASAQAAKQSVDGVLGGAAEELDFYPAGITHESVKVLMLEAMLSDAVTGALVRAEPTDHCRASKAVSRLRAEQHRIPL